MKSSINHFVALALLSAAPLTARAAIVTGSTVNNTATNHALTGTASQSSTTNGGVASRAIDGNVDGHFNVGSTTHTDTGSPQWWQVDLGTDRTIDQVVLYNRDGCCPERLSNYRVSVLDASNNEVAGQNFLNHPVGGAQPVNFGGITGRTVKVQGLGVNNFGDHVLSLAEVTVLDYANYVNIAAGKPSSQSSTDFGGSAARGNDGDTSGLWWLESVTHTDGSNTSPIWWQVDLQGDYFINEISLHARTDCCAGRQGNYRLSIMDNGSEVWGMDVAPGAPGSDINFGTLFSVWENAGGFIGTGDAVRVSLIDNRNNTSEGGVAPHYLMLAEVQVFGIPVPEPSSTALAALAGLTLLRRRRR